jgi:hypothetical protein
MSDVASLEHSYRRCLRWYPREFRRDHESEVLAVLMAGTRAGQLRPALIEQLDLIRSALWMRLRPSRPRSDRVAYTALKLMLLGAVVELATAVTIIATMGQIRSNVAARNPSLTHAQWQAAVAGELDPLVVAAGVAVAFWLLMAWASGRGHRWAGIAFAVFFAMNTQSLLTGLAGGSATYARPDLAIGTVLWLIELAVVVLLLGPGVRSLARAGAGRHGHRQGWPER